MSWKKRMVPDLPMKSQPVDVQIEYCEWLYNKQGKIEKGLCRNFKYIKEKNRWVVDPASVETASHLKNPSEKKDEEIRKLLRKLNGHQTSADILEEILADTNDPE